MFDGWLALTSRSADADDRAVSPSPFHERHRDVQFFNGDFLKSQSALQSARRASNDKSCMIHLFCRMVPRILLNFAARDSTHFAVIEII